MAAAPQPAQVRQQNRADHTRLNDQPASSQTRSVAAIASVSSSSIRSSGRTSTTTPVPSTRRPKKSGTCPSRPRRVGHNSRTGCDTNPATCGSQSIRIRVITLQPGLARKRLPHRRRPVVPRHRPQPGLCTHLPHRRQQLEPRPPHRWQRLTTADAAPIDVLDLENTVPDVSERVRNTVPQRRSPQSARATAAVRAQVDFRAEPTPRAAQAITSRTTATATATATGRSPLRSGCQQWLGAGGVDARQVHKAPPGMRRLRAGSRPSP